MPAMLVLLRERSLPLEACPGDCASTNQARASMEIWRVVHVLAPDLIRPIQSIINEDLK